MMYMSEGEPYGTRLWYKERCEQLEAENERLREMLSETKAAIERIPDRSVFGIGGDGIKHWYLVDDLLSNIEDVLDRGE